jgi:hypothetical protein
MPKHHTTHDIDRALTALAITGTSQAAAQQTGISQRTIRDWRHKHPDRWHDITTRRAHLIDQACINEFRQIVLNATTATQQAVALTQADLTHDLALPAQAAALAQRLTTANDPERETILAELDQLHPRIKDASTAAKNLATTAAIATDKIAVMEGRPTSIIEHRTTDDILRGLEARGYVNSTTTEDTTPTTAFLPQSTDDNTRDDQDS